MIGYDICPYCDKETEIYYEGINEGEEFDVECSSCKKTFKCSYSESITFFCDKIDEGKQ